MSSTQRKREAMKEKALEAGMSYSRYRALAKPSNMWGDTLQTIKRRAKKKGYECTITIYDVRVAYENQNGKCAITGWDFEPKRSGSGLIPTTLTIDQIEHGKGYVPGNIRLVCYQANNARYVWSDEQLFEFCEAVANNRRPK